MRYVFLLSLLCAILTSDFPILQDTTASPPAAQECPGYASPVQYCNTCTCTPMSSIVVHSDAGCETGCFVSGSFTCGGATANVPIFIICGGRDAPGFNCGPPFGCPNGNAWLHLACGSCQ